MFEDIYILTLITGFLVVLIVGIAQHFTAETINALTAAGTILLAGATAYVASMGYSQLRILEADQRPWLFISSPAQITSIQSAPPSLPDLPLAYRAWLVDLTFPIKNTGRAPAIRASVSAKLISKLVFGSDGPELLTAQQKFCAEVAKIDHPQVIEYYVFPNDIRLIPKPNILSEDELQNNRNAHRHMLEPVLVGSISYYVYASTEQHQTTFIYDLRRRDRMPIYPDAGPPALSDLILEPSIQGNGIAN